MTIHTRSDAVIASMREALKEHEDFGPFYDAAELAEIERQLQAMMARADREHKQEETETDV